LRTGKKQAYNNCWV